MGRTEDDPRNSVLSQLVESVKAISELPECRNMFRKMYGNFVRRVKLLSPLFEELRDSDKELGDEEVAAFESLGEALHSAKELIKSVNQGSKLYQHIEYFNTMSSSKSGIVRLRSSDNEIFNVEKGMAVMSTTIKNIVEDTGAYDVIQLVNVDANILGIMIPWCKKHAKGENTKEQLEVWDAEFVEVLDLDVLIDLIDAAYNLRIEELLDQSLQRLADIITENTDEEIWQMLHIENSFFNRGKCRNLQGTCLGF